MTVRKEDTLHYVACGDALELARAMEEKADLLVTSPPYWAKRTYYNGENEIGSEATPIEYVNRVADVFVELSAYVKDEGNLFINIGDTFFGSGAGAWSKYIDDDGNRTETQKKMKEKFFVTKPLQPKIKQDGKLYQNKQMLLIPSRFAIAMQERGFILRDDIIWHKPNRIPSGVADRFINTYEHVFHFVKKKKYFFDLEAVKVMGKNGRPKNPGDVWSINTQALKDNDHTATFPEELIEKIVLCGSPENGIVFDPFLGSGTTWIVCERLRRSCVGFEINKDYFLGAQKRFAEIYEKETV